MADVIVNTAVIELRTCKLNKTILKQLRNLTYENLREIGQEAFDKMVAGWVDTDSILNDGSSTTLIVRLTEGDYARFNAHYEQRKRFPQIFIV